MNKKIYEDKRLIISFVLIILTIIFSIINSVTQKTNENKYISNKDYVFTVDKNNNSKLPFINIASDEIQKINDEIEEKYYSVISSNQDTYLTYEYSIKNDFLSILITEKAIAEIDDIPDVTYYTYYIDIKNKKIYTNTEILDKFNLNHDDIQSTVDKSIEDQYKYEAESGYIVSQECDLSCYKEIRKYTGIDNNMNFYVKDDKVYGYLNITNRTYYYTSDIYPEYKYMFEF